MSAHPRRPFPWSVLFHWAGRYLPIWFFLSLIIFIVQTVLSYMLHDREDLKNFLRLLDTAPKFFKALIGGDELMPGNTNGIVAIGYQHPLVLLMLMTNAVTTTTGLLTAEADRGTMELMLSRPITRGRVFMLTIILAVLSQIVLVAALFSGTAVWTRVFDYGESVDLSLFLKVSVNVVALAIAVVGISTLSAVWFSERNHAIGAVVAYLVISYLMNFAVVFVPRFKFVQNYTLFTYCNPNGVLRDGLSRWDLSLLGGIALATLAAAFIIWRRKDIQAA